MKQAILLSSVSLGNTGGGIQTLYKKIKQKFPHIKIYHGYTGNFMKMENPDDFLFNKIFQIKKDGIQQAIALGFYLNNGVEYQKFYEIVKQSEICPSISKPLLCNVEQQLTLAQLLIKNSPRLKQECWVYIAHGSNQQEQEYAILQRLLLEYKREDIVLTNLMDKRAKKKCIAQLQKQKANCIHLLPFMLEGGKHTTQDIFGEKNSWKQHFIEKGYTVICHKEHLGHFAEIQGLYLEWIQQQLDCVL